MSTSTSVTTVVLVDDPMRKETIAVAGFLAGYCGSTRRSYATDLRTFLTSRVRKVTGALVRAHEG